MSWVRRLAVLAATGLAVLLMGTSYSWAAHSPAPVPSLAPGQVPVPTGWTCHGSQVTTVSGADTANTCQVAGWTVSRSPASMTLPLPVVEQSPVAHPASVKVEPGSAPIPVDEVDPTTTATLDCTAACKVEAVITEPQYAALTLIGASLLMFVLFSLVRREGRAFRA